jgi:hypothetical protein
MRVRVEPDVRKDAAEGDDDEVDDEIKDAEEGCNSKGSSIDEDAFHSDI